MIAEFRNVCLLNYEVVKLVVATGKTTKIMIIVDSEIIEKYHWH